MNFIGLACFSLLPDRRARFKSLTLALVMRQRLEDFETVVTVHSALRNLPAFPQPLPQPSTKILNSWKEIASYLGRGVRTTQRYEQKLGLPVHRPAAKNRSSVLAFSDELERWLRNTPNRNGTHPNPTNGNSLPPVATKADQTRSHVGNELEHAKQEMERAHQQYLRALDHYNALKHQAEIKRTVPNPETENRVRREKDRHEQHFTTIS